METGIKEEEINKTIITIEDLKIILKQMEMQLLKLLHFLLVDCHINLLLNQFLVYSLLLDKFNLQELLLRNRLENQEDLDMLSSMMLKLPEKPIQN